MLAKQSKAKQSKAMQCKMHCIAKCIAKESNPMTDEQFDEL